MPKADRNSHDGFRKEPRGKGGPVKDAALIHVLKKKGTPLRF